MNITKEDMKRITETINEISKIMIADLQKNFKLLDEEFVDGEPWYTVQIQNRDIWFWLTQQEGSWSHYHCDVRKMPLVDMEEKVYLALVMRWS